ncbi:MAG TPA: VWA domain-containing protein [Pyrinomonadaceae bacterium]|nr:VWA domain-containing protein [Pyrinomonadaceae bacterium]
MFSNKRFVRVLALALAAAAASAGARAQQQQQSPPQPAAQQQQKPAPKADETIDDDEVERVETDLTNVLFTATDRNKRFITNIKQEDITVLEDGVAQQVFTFQRNVDLPLSLAILIDTSNSQERTLPEEKRAAQQFVDTVIRPNKDEVAVLSFTGETTLEQGLTGSASRARRAIERVEFQPPSGYIGGGLVVTTPGGVGGGTPPISGDNQNRAGSTAIWDSIWVTSREVLSETSDKTRRAIILLTDGDDTSSRMKLNEAIDSALKVDAIVYAIGIGDSFTFSGVDEGSLRKITERTGGRAYFPRSETDLRSAFAQIQDELREQYLVAYSPSNKAKDGTFRKVQIDFKDPELRKNMKLTYRQGYFARSAVDAKAGRK